MKIMSKQAIEAKRGTVFHLEPERLTLVTDKNHPLYDPRVELPYDESMVLNIALHGVLEPILIRKNGTAIEVVAGRGRTKAALEVNRRLKAEGKPTLLIPAMLKGGTDADLFGILISENEIRHEDSMINKGEKARKLLNMGRSIQEIALTFGVSRQSVENWLNIQQLPEKIKTAVENKELSATAAIQLSDYSREEQVKRYEDIKQQGAKPTVKNMQSAANSVDNKPMPKMRTRKEIEYRLNDNAFIYPSSEYMQAYETALKWVLGEDINNDKF